MSQYIHKSHNVSVLLYHLVFPAKYRRAELDEGVDETLREVCLEIEKRYELKFLEIGVDENHVHFLVQSIPGYKVTKIVTLIKSLTAREILRRCPQVEGIMGATAAASTAAAVATAMPTTKIAGALGARASMGAIKLGGKSSIGGMVGLGGVQAAGRTSHCSRHCRRG